MLSEVKPDASRCAVSLMTRQYAQVLSGLPERKVSLAGLFAWPGPAGGNLLLGSDYIRLRICALYFLIAKIIDPELIEAGFTAIIVSIWLVGGIIISVLSVIGIYVSRLYIEAKGPPRAIVRRIYTFKKMVAHECVSCGGPYGRSLCDLNSSRAIPVALD